MPHLIPDDHERIFARSQRILQTIPFVDLAIRRELMVVTVTKVQKGDQGATEIACKTSRPMDHRYPEPRKMVEREARVLPM